jgi:phosphatidylserine/phosphatidylglycerophosphate/cardiolipin synthase-like enzyme
MRAVAVGTSLKVRAIAGLHVVVLAWDFVEPRELTGGQLPAGLTDLLGFSLERTEWDAHGTVVERYVLRGIKRFRTKDVGLAPGTPVPLDEHPVQTFQWADYTAKPDTDYRYRVVPLHGTPKLLTPDNDGAVEVAVRTEAESGGSPDGAGPRHDMYFNRGVIGSQAYARRFLNVAPDPGRPDSEPMKWLSRGLFEALVGFVDRARDERFALRAAFYEFHYPPVAAAFRQAMDRGADVKIVYDAESSYRVENAQTLRAAGLEEPDVSIPRTVTEGIRHNKFIVLLDREVPIGVWTGSTNISPSGIFGQSNVGHVVWGQTIAASYLAYWDRLAANLTPTKLREPNRAASPLPAQRSAANSVLPLYSPRDDRQSNATLQWYADRMAEAQHLVCFTVAFSIDVVFQQVIARDNDVLRYIVKDDDLGDGETIGRDRDVLFAGGGRFDDGSLPTFLGERDNPLSSNDYIHTKYLLVDPLDDDPLVVSGSANFSKPSQRTNDENMLVIRGDTRVADCYFGEFMRIFDHHYARYIVRKLAGTDSADPDAGYLKPTAAAWLPAHLDDRSYKSKRRRYFVGQ